jgi:hypothetical protein
MIYNTHLVSNELWLKCNFILIKFIYQTLFLLKSMKKVQSMNYHKWLEKPWWLFSFTNCTVNSLHSLKYLLSLFI